jgi:hypothetical protein
MLMHAQSWPAPQSRAGTTDGGSDFESRSVLQAPEITVHTTASLRFSTRWIVTRYYRSCFLSARFISRPRSRNMACHIFSRNVVRLAGEVSFMIVHPFTLQENYHVTGRGWRAHFALQCCVFSGRRAQRTISLIDRLN